MYRVYWYNDLTDKWTKYLYPDKPIAASGKEWHEYEKKQKETPVRYWFAETLPEIIEHVFWPFEKFHDLKYWIYYRFMPRHQYNKIETKLEPGYYDVDTRMLHGMFEMLVDFIEVEKAWMHVISDEKPLTRRTSWNFRDPKAGLAHLDWEISLGDTSLPIEEQNPSQAFHAAESKELYNWWKNIRPNRPDPYESDAWDEYMKKIDKDEYFMQSHDEATPEDDKKSKEMFNKTRNLEVLYNQEDEDMLIRLIKIRQGLWT